MRNFDALPYRCITDELGDDVAAKFWYHGGDGRFDGQEAFWLRHNIVDVMTMNSFPKETARTGWGVGDFSFFKEAAKKIQSMSQQPAKFFVGMLLSVTNHIPWHLPKDADVESEADEPWLLTTSYSDQSVGALVEDLKRSNTWSSTLLIVLSDHGNKTKPYSDLYLDSRNSNQLLQSHINLIMSGGIAEAALTNINSSSIVFDHVVSQADVAATLADLVELQDFLTMGKNLFDQGSDYPIMSQTEEGIYLPILDEFIPYSELNSKLTPSDAPNWLYKFHYKAALEYLLEMRSAR